MNTYTPEELRTWRATAAERFDLSVPEASPQVAVLIEQLADSAAFTLGMLDMAAQRPGGWLDGAQLRHLLRAKPGDPRAVLEAAGIDAAAPLEAFAAWAEANRLPPDRGATLAHAAAWLRHSLYIEAAVAAAAIPDHAPEQED